MVLKLKIERSRQSTKLLTYGLTNFDLVNISKKDEPISVMLMFGSDKKNDCQGLYESKIFIKQ